MLDQEVKQLKKSGASKETIELKTLELKEAKEARVLQEKELKTIAKTNPKSLEGLKANEELKEQEVKEAIKSGAPKITIELK